MKNDTPTQTTVNLSWDYIFDANFYQVFRNGSSLGYTRNDYWNDTALTPDTLYLYAVRANDSYNNCGLNSSGLFVKTEQLFILLANVRIEPETLNLASKGEITAFINLPSGYDVANINASTVVCEGAHIVKWNVASDKTFIAKFNRQDLVNVSPGDAVKLTVKGLLKDGTPFEGYDTIRVIYSQENSKDGGSQSTGYSGGDGNSTGGSGVISSEPQDNIARVGRMELNLLAGQSTEYSFPDLICTYQVIVNSNETEPNIDMRVEELKGTSGLVSASVAGNVYMNFNIWAGTKNIKSALLRCKVENSWISSNSLESSDVKMLRWNKTKWLQLKTYEKNKDSVYTYYDAETNAFSSFAVTGLRSAIQTAEPEVTATPEVTLTAVPQLKPKSLGWIMYVLVAIVICTGV